MKFWLEKLREFWLKRKGKKDDEAFLQKFFQKGRKNDNILFFSQKDEGAFSEIFATRWETIYSEALAYLFSPRKVPYVILKFKKSEIKK